jgi:hypothetical protein
MNNLVPTVFHVQRAQDLVRSASNQDTYFLFVGDHVPNPSDSLATPIVSGSQLSIDVFDNMIQGKQIQPSDVSLMVPRIVWTTGTVYTAFSPTNTSTCHVVVETGFSYGIYKCLANANNGPSTVAPTGTNSMPFTTSDGYTWKYIYSVNQPTYDKFKTTSKMPFVANTINEAAAVPGTIDIVTVVNGGLGYGNYYISQFRSGDIAITSTTYKLVETASNLNNFYVGCIIKVTSPSSPAVGQFRRITGYTVSANVKTITIESAFSSNPNPTDAYEIYPEVKITSTNSAANTAVAIAIINPATSNSVSSVEILSSGANNRTATATVLYNAAVSVIAPAVVTPIVSNSLGHGGNPLVELKASTVGFSTSISASDANSAFSSTSNDYRQIGIIRNPKFNNVSCSANGTGFVVGETINQYKVVSVLAANTTLTGTTLTGDANSTFLSSLQQGDVILVANTTSKRMATISYVSSNTAAVIQTAVGNIAGSTSFVRLVADGVVASANSTRVVLNNTSPVISALYPIFGSTSFVSAPITTLSFNTNSNSSTFIQASRFSGVTHSGSFADDETISGPSGTGKFHSYTANGSIWTVAATNITGIINVGDVITGQTSGASMTISAKYNGDLSLDKGQIVFVENIVPVTRISNKTENFKITLEL